MITEKAMLVAVHISVWTAVKHDRDASREIAKQHGAEEGVGRYNKKLLRQAEKLEAIRTIAGKIRQYVYSITLPWTDEGLRILPANLYFDLARQRDIFEQQFHAAVRDFLAEYPSYIERVKPALNGLYRPEDYPDANKIKEKFDLSLEILPIVTGDDFRVQLSEQQRARIAREIDSNIRTRLARGTQDLFVRLRKVVQRMVDRLNEPEGRLHSSVVDNVRDLVEVLPSLNLTEDPDLDTFVEEVKARLCSYSAKELKHNELLRAATVQDASDIVSRMAAFMTPPALSALPPVEKSHDNSSTEGGAMPPSVDQILNQMSGYMGSAL